MTDGGVWLTDCVSHLQSHDLVVCVDSAVLDDVRRLSGGRGEHVLLLSDFLAHTGERMEALDDEMQQMLAPHYSEALAAADLPSAYTSSQGPEWERVLAAAALSSACMTSFLKRRIDGFFVDEFNALLRRYFGTPEKVAATPWAEADRQLRDAAQVTGGLSPEQRRELYEQHAAAVIASARPGHDEQGGADQ